MEACHTRLNGKMYFFFPLLFLFFSFFSRSAPFYTSSPGGRSGLLVPATFKKVEFACQGGNGFRHGAERVA
jgi:hypothetical protein